MAIMMAAAICLASSCAAPKVIHDTQYITKTDSIYITKVDKQVVKDSVFIKEKGDTFYVYKYRYVDRYKVDTLIRERTDTVYKTITETKTEYIVKDFTGWQKLRLRLGNILLVALVLGAAYLCIRYRDVLLSIGKKIVRFIIDLFS